MLATTTTTRPSGPYADGDLVIAQAVMSDLAPLAFGAVVSEVTKLGASNVHVIGNGPIVLCALHRLSDMDLNAFQDRLEASAAIADEVASRVASGSEN